jgi:predicted nucleic acid-binding Zn ribbon protein
MGTSKTKQCRLCGGPVAGNSVYGVCRNNSTCVRENNRVKSLAYLRRLAALPHYRKRHTPAPHGHCIICGGRIQTRNPVGICQTHCKAHHNRYRRRLDSLQVDDGGGI